MGKRLRVGCDNKTGRVKLSLHMLGSEISARIRVFELLGIEGE